MSLAFHPLRVASVARDADSLVVGFDVPAPDREHFRFTQGQYLTLRTEIAGEDVRRSYSICSGVDDGTLCIGIRMLPGGVFSGWADRNLHEGQTLQVLPPQGRFFVPVQPDAKRHVLLVAAGSGITPMMSLARTLLAKEPGTRVSVIYGNRRLATTMFREELQELKNRYLPRLALYHVFSREAQEAPLFHGRLDRERLGEFLRTLVPADGVDEVFVCGPLGMIDEAVAALAAAGVPDERVHAERFGDYGTASPHRVEEGDADRARVTLIVDGLARDVEFQLSDPSILDAAKRSGLDVPYSCKSGVCSTCKGKLLEGQVRMDRNFALTAAEVAQGFVLCCQSHPTTDRVVITLDER